MCFALISGTAGALHARWTSVIARFFTRSKKQAFPPFVTTAGRQNIHVSTNRKVSASEQELSSSNQSRCLAAFVPVLAKLRSGGCAERRPTAAGFQPDKLGNCADVAACSSRRRHGGSWLRASAAAAVQGLQNWSGRCIDGQRLA